MREGRQQDSGPTVCSVDWLALWLDRGTSLDGLTSKKLVGFNDTANFSTGMTGKSRSWSVKNQQLAMEATYLRV
jgi:hypothetical protein